MAYVFGTTVARPDGPFSNLMLCLPHDNPTSPPAVAISNQSLKGCQSVKSNSRVADYQAAGLYDCSYPSL